MSSLVGPGFVVSPGLDDCHVFAGSVVPMALWQLLQQPPDSFLRYFCRHFCIPEFSKLHRNCGQVEPGDSQSLLPISSIIALPDGGHDMHPAQLTVRDVIPSLLAYLREFQARENQTLCDASNDDQVSKLVAEIALHCSMCGWTVLENASGTTNTTPIDLSCSVCLATCQLPHMVAPSNEESLTRPDASATASRKRARSGSLSSPREASNLLANHRFYCPWVSGLPIPPRAQQQAESTANSHLPLKMPMSEPLWQILAQRLGQHLGESREPENGEVEYDKVDMDLRVKSFLQAVISPQARLSKSRT
jgi:hypothetical protein